MPFALNWALANVVDETKGQKKRSWNWTRMEDGKAVELLWCTRCPIDSWRNYTLYTILQQSKFFSQFSACRNKPVGIGLCRWSCWNISIYEVRSIVSQGVFEACVFFFESSQSSPFRHEELPRWFVWVQPCWAPWAKRCKPWRPLVHPLGLGAVTAWKDSVATRFDQISRNHPSSPDFHQIRYQISDQVLQKVLDQLWDMDN